jgi:acyl carrier protein
LRLYRTGDQARYWTDGNLEFLGRTDHQVKIRGFRIELGEIEAALNSHRALRESIVVAYHDGGEKRLVAYIVASQMPAPTTSELRHFLQELLPEYMVPSAFVALAALPMTSNGKVDRKALPAPDTVRPELAAAFVAPRTAVEGTLAAHWTEVLGIDCVGIYDNFFELGGHSLLASQLIARLRDAFQVEIALHSLFEAPTVAGLAEAIETIQWAIQSQPAPDSLLIAEEFVL